jgi:hypothetical protein
LITVRESQTMAHQQHQPPSEDTFDQHNPANCESNVAYHMANTGTWQHWHILTCTVANIQVLTAHSTASSLSFRVISAAAVIETAVACQKCLHVASHMLHLPHMNCCQCLSVLRHQSFQAICPRHASQPSFPSLCPGSQPQAENKPVLAWIMISCR